MAKLIYKYWNHKGYYNFVADINRITTPNLEGPKGSINTKLEIDYKVKSSLFESNKEGKLEGQDACDFVNLLDKADIQGWEDAYYPEEQMIADQGQFNICYVDDNANIYFTLGEELCEPFGYHKMLEAIAVADADVCKLMLDKSLDE